MFNCQAIFISLIKFGWKWYFSLQQNQWIYANLNYLIEYSIRMPSFFNGIFGHKPSTGIVPNGPGQIPVAHGEIDKFLGKFINTYLIDSKHYVVLALDIIDLNLFYV